jgi:DMSO reductase anchor subunit
MLLTLPLILFMVMAELTVGAFTVLFLLDWRNLVKRSFLITYAIIYLILTVLTFLFQQGFSSPDLLNTFSMLDKAWTGYLSLSLLLFLVLMIPYAIFLGLDKTAGVDGRLKAKEAAVEGTQRSTLRLLRLISGGLAALAGLVTLFVLGMIFRPLASTSLAGAFIVGSFFASALAIGGVMTAMWLGHWYLVTPALSEKPLQFAATLVLIGILAQVVFAFSAGLSTAAHSQVTNATVTPAATATPAVSAATPVHNSQAKPANAPVVAPLGTDVIGWLRILVAFVLPLILLGFILKLIHDRSFQSATGMLYLVVVLTLAGEAMARGLFLAGLQ